MHAPRFIGWLAALAIPSALSAGCASTYYSARFGPATSEAMVSPPQKPEAAARVLVSVIGVRKPDSKSGTPAEAELRMRMENLGRVPVRPEEHSLELLSGALEPFGTARIVSQDPPVVAPGAASTFDLFFPMPGRKSPEEVDLRSLNLRFTLDFDGQPVTTGINFERVVPVYDPYWSEPGVSIGVGFVSTH
jgi:hypothetical protein